jgi:hypothetical protein
MSVTRSARSLALAIGTLALLACSPEARRTRDGGPGADPGNKILVMRDEPDPHAADTTLWPGRAPAPVDLLAKGLAPFPTYPPATVESGRDTVPVTPKTPPSTSQQRIYDSGRAANPRRQTSPR